MTQVDGDVIEKIKNDDDDDDDDDDDNMMIYMSVSVSLVNL